MKYLGRSLILYLTIVALLYGTSEVWAYADYSKGATLMPAAYKPSGLYAGVGRRRGFRPSYAELRGITPVSPFAGAGGLVEKGGVRGGGPSFGGDPRTEM